jgi:hypothetical protein
VNIQSGEGHAVITISMHFESPKARTTEAFGPVSESKWAPTFRPQFVHPHEPAQVAGAVFTTGKGNIWLLHDFDVAAGRVQYVIVDEDAETTLTIHVTGTGQSSDATMVYDMVALDDSGAAHLTEMQQHARELSGHMQRAITGYLSQTVR